jgi:hypothetical protein
MSATLQRDQVCLLARSDPRKALEKAKVVSDPWFRAQALAWVARFTDADPLPIATLAANAATGGADDYQRSAVRAWEVAALGERGLKHEAGTALKEAVRLAETVLPAASRSEAMSLLLHAAFAIDPRQAAWVRERLEATCPEDAHWRCRRARRDARRLTGGEERPRGFFG